MFVSKVTAAWTRVGATFKLLTTGKILEPELVEPPVVGVDVGVGGMTGFAEVVAVATLDEAEIFTAASKA
jgi:hypothetical protein